MERAIPDPFGHGWPTRRDSMVVLYDNAFSVGHIPDVGVMVAPHRHTQFEINHVLTGSMTYSFEGRIVTVEGGETAIFFGMVPHQVTACAPGTRFVCIYVPIAVLLGLHLGETLTQALFGGSFVRGVREFETDTAQFLRWRGDLLLADGMLSAIVRDEIGARLRRIEHDGWFDARSGAADAAPAQVRKRPHNDKVAKMTRFIADHCGEGIKTDDVARAAGLHPNYAMTLFRAAVGMTMTDYLTRNRLDAAQTMLACSDDEVAAIAFSAGFGSLSRFYEAFKSRFGTSPSAFRTTLRRARTGGDDARP